MKKRELFIEKVKNDLLHRRGEMLGTLSTQSQEKVSDGQVQDTGDEALSLSMEKLQNTIQQTNITTLTQIYAEAGIWYDAFAQISNLIENDPRNSLWKKQRASLLEQVGLRQVAQFEMDKISDF